MVLVVGFLLLVSLLATAVLGGVTSFLDRIVPAATVLAFLLNLLLSAGVTTVLFAMIFKVLPDVKIEWRDVWLGAGVTVVLFELGKFGLSIYLGKGGATSGFGAAGSVVLLLLWVYYASCILFFGAEFTQVYAQAMGRFITPEDTHESASEEKAPSKTANLVRRRGPSIAVLVPALDARNADFGDLPPIVPIPATNIVPATSANAGVSPLVYLAISSCVGFVATYLARRAVQRPSTPLERIAEVGKGAIGLLGHAVKRTSAQRF
jgi:hypothetical protein